jgi:hypothetical protein
MRRSAVYCGHLVRAGVHSALCTRDAGVTSAWWPIRDASMRPRPRIEVPDSTIEYSISLSSTVHPPAIAVNGPTYDPASCLVHRRGEDVDTDERQVALRQPGLLLKAHHPSGGIEFGEAERPRVCDLGSA